jgi:branched-chain amino acid transport system ATP-binding protein
MPLLEVTDCTKKFGGLTAVSGFSLTMESGELVGLIGPNGAVKTTAFNLLTGVYTPTSGRILFQGRSIAGHKPSQIAASGISRTFQNIRLFSQMSVLDNIRTASHLHFKPSLAAAFLRTQKLLDAEAKVNEDAHELLKRFDLDSSANELACNLPYGQQRRLEIARALATKPKLLCLDEPAAGMNPQEKVELMEQIRSILDEFHLTILLIEHDMRLVMSICHRILVLDQGELIAEGTPQEIQKNSAVIEAYLGQPEDEA